MKATEILKNIKTILGEEIIEETPVELQEEVADDVPAERDLYLFPLCLTLIPEAYTVFSL